ncbi:MAG: 4a-hydroxytetrahydrobiopterin dehydratase [Burkholderiaceae bacterium]
MPNDLNRVLETQSLADIAADLSGAGWATRADGKAIEKRYQFADFRAAMAFMMQASFEADSADHHPEWFNVYNRVDVTLTTHDAGGVTERDLSLARAMEKIVASA